MPITAIQKRVSPLKRFTHLSTRPHSHAAHQLCCLIPDIAHFVDRLFMNREIKPLINYEAIYELWDIERIEYNCHMVKSFISRLEVFEGRLYDQHVKVPENVVSFYKDKGINRFVAQLNDGDQFACAILSAGEEGKYLIISNDLKKKNNLSLGDELTVRLEPDNSKYGMPLPVEMEELLLQEPDFELYFDKLTPGKQRALIFQVSKLKSENKRVEKSIVISRYLVEQKGKLDFKELNEAFKRGI